MVTFRRNSGYPAARLAREDLIQANGTVEKILGGGRYQITLETGQSVTAQLSGRMRRFRIRVIPGSRPTIPPTASSPSACAKVRILARSAGLRAIQLRIVQLWDRLRLARLRA